MEQSDISFTFKCKLLSPVMPFWIAIVNVLCDLFYFSCEVGIAHV